MIKYNKYKPSGVEWIGDIPEHWGKCRLKNISTSVNGYSFKSDDFDREYDIPVIRIGDVGDIIDFEDCVKVKSKFLEEKKDYIIRKDDILIGLTGGTIGKSGRYNYEIPSLLNQRVGLLRNKKEVLNGLLYHYVKSEVFIRYIFYDCYGGGQDNISMNDIMNMVFPLPPSQEQLQIVQFLDEKTNLINKLISTKERKISFLKEQRTSLINQVVTKGLNPNVKMKGSGVEWIGEIPEEWVVNKLGRIINTKQGIQVDYEEQKFIKEEGYLRFLRISDYTNLDEEPRYVRVLNSQNYQVKVDDIVMFRYGDSGRVVRGIEGLICNNLFTIKTKNNQIDNNYLFTVLSSDIVYQLLRNSSDNPTLKQVSHTILNNFIIPIPSIEEQLQIVEYLDSKTKEIDYLIELEEKKIDLLKEYRQSLISEVVTGKIKVTTDE